MDAQELKDRIIEDDKIVDILDSLGMHSINSKNNKYITCGMPDGDNPKSTVIYKDNLKVDAYTRNIKDKYGVSDIISLVTFINDSYITQSIKWICDVCNYDYYGKDIQQSKLKNWINKMWQAGKASNDDVNENLQTKKETILSYYKPFCNNLFYNDNIDYDTQVEFELGYDLKTHMITIPIRDELGVLVGVKGRLYKSKVEEWESKYTYLESCAKSKVLYGLHKTLPYIKEKREVIVVEAEKSVMQLWSMGYRNAVAIGGHILSESHVKKLSHLNSDIVIAFDEGVEKDSEGNINKNYYKDEFDKFLDKQTIYCVYDKNKTILSEKESPSDNPDKWEELYSNYKIKVRGD